MTITRSPTSMNGVHFGLRLPVRIEATSEARCPTVSPAASTTYHFLFPARSLPLGKYVDIVNYLCFGRLKRERLEYKSARKIVKLRGLAGSVLIWILELKLWHGMLSTDNYSWPFFYMAGIWILVSGCCWPLFGVVLPTGILVWLAFWYGKRRGGRK